MAMWPAIAWQYAIVISRTRLTFEACFRRLDALLEELKGSEQQQNHR